MTHLSPSDHIEAAVRHMDQGESLQPADDLPPNLRAIVACALVPWIVIGLGLRIFNVI